MGRAEWRNTFQHRRHFKGLFITHNGSNGIRDGTRRASGSRKWSLSKEDPRLTETRHREGRVQEWVGSDLLDSSPEVRRSPGTGPFSHRSHPRSQELETLDPEPVQGVQGLSPFESPPSVVDSFAPTRLDRQ